MRAENSPRSAAELGLASLLAEIRGCRACLAPENGKPLPHEPRPVLRATVTARLAVCGQAPGVRVHGSGVPFSDPSGVRLRAWMGVSEPEFYDETRVAIVPMGFCFPGHDAKGGDLPPRRECANLWRRRLFDLMPGLELVLLVGLYAQAWHLERGPASKLSTNVLNWRAIFELGATPRLFPLPHPSWRNNAWIARNPWFESELLPRLRTEVRQLMS